MTRYGENNMNLVVQPWKDGSLGCWMMLMLDMTLGADETGATVLKLVGRVL